MNEQLGFPTISELVKTMLKDARFVIPQDERNDQADSIDPASISRKTPVVKIFRDAVRHYLKVSTEAVIEKHVSAAIAEFNSDQRRTRGIELRHPEVWFRYPVEVVHAQLDAMMYRNQQINGVIVPQDFVEWLVEYGADEVTPKELHKKSAIRKVMSEVWTMNGEDPLSFTDIFQSFADEYFVHLDSSQRYELERKHTLETICGYLTEKLHERKPNDGLVQYGSMRGAERFEQEREQFDGRWGGIGGVAAGLAAKHISGLFEILGSKFGIIDRVPEEDRAGPLKEARAPIRIWLRTAPKEVTKGLGMFALLSKELEYYQSHPETPHVDYCDHAAMLEDGWVLD